MPPQDVRNAVYLLGCLVDTGRFVFFPALKIILPATINYGNSLAISVTMMSPSWVARKREDAHPSKRHEKATKTLSRHILHIMVCGKSSVRYDKQ